jgi:cyclase
MRTVRHLWQTALLTVATLVMGTMAQAQSGLTSIDLGNGLTLVSGAGANVVVAEGPDAIVIVDGGTEEHAPALLAEINRLTGNKPVAALFNTNWRPDKTGLNHLLGPAGVRIIAHENTRLWQTVDISVAWADRVYPPLPKAAQANETFYTTGSMMLGSETIEYGFLSQASTDGDIYVRFVNADVLVVGDMLGAGAYPLLDYVTGGWIGGAQKATAALLSLAGENTRVIAAGGQVQDLQALQAQADMFDHAYAKVAEAFKTGRSLAQFRDSDPMAGFADSWGNPDLFLQLLYKGTWYHVPARAVPGII